MAFRGTFDYTLDAKNRLTVPAKFRAVLAGGVVLAKGTEACVALWTAPEFDAYVTAGLAGLHPLDAQADRINRYFQSNSHDTELDSAGRVMVPTWLIDHGHLTKDVVVTGVGHRLEVWDRVAWATYNASLDIADLTAAFGQTPA